ncbi:hypothetical protein Q671_09740 [Halomonas sp. PBN3]|nr:hypothetical protein Q671_09740 [Halomonas sp. PBN3]
MGALQNHLWPVSRQPSSVGSARVVARGSVCVAARGGGSRGIATHIAAALFLGHGHAEGEPPFVRCRQCTRVIVAGQQAGRPVGLHMGGVAQYRHGGVGHGYRAAEARFGLGQQVKGGDMGLVAAVPLLMPGHGMPAALHGQAHQLVIGGMVSHLVQAPAVAVEEAQLRRMAVGRLPQRLDVLAAGLAAQCGEPFGDPRRGLPGQGLAQRKVLGEQVAVATWGWLVGHLMGGQAVTGCIIGHGGSPHRRP